MSPRINIAGECTVCGNCQIADGSDQDRTQLVFFSKWKRLSFRARAQHQILSSIRHDTGSLLSRDGSLAQDGFERLEIGAKTVSKVADFPGMLLNHVERQSIGFALQFPDRRQQWHSKQNPGYQEQNRDGKKRAHEVAFRKRSVLSQWNSALVNKPEICDKAAFETEKMLTVKPSARKGRIAIRLR